MKALILAFSFKPSYHVLRQAKSAGYEVHVLGRDCARGMKYSRFCSSFQNLYFDPSFQSVDTALAEIKRAIVHVSADVIVPSDIVSTRLLGMLADRLPIPSYPVPSPAVFDMMNDKWEFYRFCKDHNIQAPNTVLCDDVASAKQMLTQGTMKIPVIIKPLDSQGGNGMYQILSESDLPLLDKVTYKPFLMQTYIPGEWVGINILANHGRIVAHAVQRNLSDRRAFVTHKKLLEGTTRIVEASGYHGAANFDAMQDEKTGELFFLECNPRFWYSLFAVDLVGLNFVKMGFNMDSLDPMNPPSVADIDVPRFGTVIKKRLTLSPLNEIERKTFDYMVSDPICALCHILPRFNDNLGHGPGSASGQPVALMALKTGIAA